MVEPEEELERLPVPERRRFRGKCYRIIATRYPPVAIFEELVPPRMLEAAWALEARTNPRLRELAGDLQRVAPQDRVTGPGAGVVMAAFTHTGRPSRFSDGSYGVYYAGRRLETAIRETVHHRELIARDAGLAPDRFSMRSWTAELRKPLHDIRGRGFEPLHDDAPRPADHPLAQAFGRRMRQQMSWGLLYNSVRHAGGECIAALRPPAVSLPTQGEHLVYEWDGERITEVYERSAPLVSFH